MKNKAVPVELGDHGFHEFVKHVPLPLMVVFFSPTCGPCRTMTPIVKTMAGQYVNQFIIATVDTSIHHQIASFFNIRGVPGFLFFKDGKLLDQIAGAVAKDVLEQKLGSL
jgi:thioredoxin 2